MEAASLTRPSDEDLARRLALGEADAFDELYRRYARPLAAYGGRLLGDRSAGEDVAQVAFLNVLQALRRGSEPRRVRAWLYRIAHNAAHDMLQRRRDAVAPSEEAADDCQEREDARRELLAAVQRLPERQRHVYALREIAGVPATEAAERLALSVKQVEQALHAARNRLAEELLFGGRVGCETVRAASGAPLTELQRRALKAHIRSCAGCRAATRSTLLRAVVGLPSFFSSIRQLVSSLLGGAALPAAKVGAVAVGAAIVATAPLTVPPLRREVAGLIGQRHAAGGWAPLPANAGAPARPPAVASSLFVPAFIRHPAPGPVRPPAAARPVGRARDDARIISRVQSAAPAARPVPTQPAPQPADAPRLPAPPGPAAAPVRAAEPTSAPSAAPASGPPAQNGSPTDAPGITTGQSATDPTPTDSTPAGAAPADGTTTDPTATDATPTDPTPTDTTPTDSTPADATSTDSTPTDPTPTDPTPTDPTPTDPTPTDPTSTDPTSTDPTSTDPTSTDPAPADPSAASPTAPGG